MSPDARLMCGLSLILIPTIVYGGLTVLWVMHERQQRKHSGVGVARSVVVRLRARQVRRPDGSEGAIGLQVLIDHAALPMSLIWPARIGAFVGPLLVSAGFFGVAHLRAVRGVLYLGALVVALTTLVVGIGLLLPA